MYENYCKIRDLKGYKDADVSAGAGVTKSTFSDWKSGRSNPKGEKLQKIANFLEVSVDELIGNASSEKQYYIDDDTRGMAQFLLDNPEYKVLFDASRKVKPEDLQKALKAIGLFIDED